MKVRGGATWFILAIKIIHSYSDSHMYILGNLNPFSEWRNPLIWNESSRKVLTHMFIVKRLDVRTNHKETTAGHGGTYSLIAT